MIENIKEDFVCDEICLENVIHKDKINEITKSLLDDYTYYELAEFLKIFGDTTRLKIIQALSINEICVCDLSSILGISQSAVSHKLKILRQFKIIKPRKEGKMVFYSLSDNHVKDIFEKALTHIRE